MRSGLWKLILLQLLGTGALLWLGYTWLGVGESDARRLAWSIAMAVVFIAGVVLLQGASLAYFRHPEMPLGRTLLTVARRLAPLTATAILAAAAYLALWMWDPKPLAVWIASGLTLLTQTPVRPAWILRVIEIVLAIVRWCALPVLLAPLASGIAARGWTGWREYKTQLRNWKYWLIAPLILFAGIWVPLWLAAWTPIRGSFSAEMASFVLRYGAAYLLFVTACLALAFATSRGKPAVSQESTTASL